MKHELSSHVQQKSSDAAFPLRGRGGAGVARAKRFIEALPANFPAPEVAVDPDGEVSLEWYRSTGRVFSVSIGADDWLSYAGKFSPSRKTQGTEVFTSDIPRVILDNIRRVMA
jgi:hypothetical protein